MDRQSFVSSGAHQYNGARPALSEWFATPQGRYVLEWELSQFDRATEDVFGYRAVQMGLHQLDFLRANRIPFRFTLALEHGASLAADPMQLPLASQSVDLVVLPHALESTADPHLVLREAGRGGAPPGARTARRSARGAARGRARADARRPARHFGLQPAFAVAPAA